MCTDDTANTMKDDDAITQTRMTLEGQKYCLKRYSIASENGCLSYGERIVIPSGMRDDVLKLLHEQHIGLVRS